MYVEITTFLIIASICAISYKGFLSSDFLDKLSLDVFRIRRGKEYRRLLTCGFVHNDWIHLLFNMITFYIFFDVLQLVIGNANSALLFLVCIVLGSLTAVGFHCNDESYTAVGASGGVAGIIFATITLVPGMEVQKMLFPISIPGWLYALIYVAGSSYAIITKRDNIGHEAHLGGAMGGMLLAILYMPQIVMVNYVAILSAGIPLLLFIMLIIFKPEILILGFNALRKPPQSLTIDQRYNEQKMQKKQTLDELLDKISRKGVKSLSEKEKILLEEYSKK